MYSAYSLGWGVIWGGGAEMTPKNRTLEGKNRMLRGMGAQKLSKIVGHHLWMILKPKKIKKLALNSQSLTVQILTNFCVICFQVYWHQCIT